MENMKSATWFMFLTTVAMVKGSNHTTIEPTTSHIPDDWSAMCSGISEGQVDQGRQFISISCHVTSGDTWDFNHFRSWSSGLNDTYVKMTVSCDAGIICLPWPYRAANLHTLIVRNCVNDCYYDDHNQPDSLESIPDSLRVFEGYGITVKASIFDLISLNVTHQAPVIDCGPLLIETYVYQGIKNIIYAPGGIEIPSSDNMTDTLIETVRDYNDLEHTCRYSNMRVYDVSQRVDASSSYLYTSLVNSRYPELRTLNLSDTEIQKFPAILATWRQRFEKLNVLDLSRNNISRFDLRDFSFISPEIGRIILRENNIKFIGIPEMHSFKSVPGAVIDIQDNPFECNCALANFSSYLQRFKGPEEAEIHRGYSYLWELQCASPPKFKGKRIASLTKEALCSTDVSHYVANIIGLSVVVVILVIIIIIMARYRKEIRILAFTRLNIILPCQPVESGGNKMYDAFVAYSHHDTSWVVKTMLPKLEGKDGVKGNFRLCLHQRDFEIGAAIADNIVQSVEASRHTILVLSKKFLESEWCLMEFRTAFHQSLIEKKKHLILVLLEDIPTHDLDSDLRRCMQTWTYIHISDRLFWDRIVFSLTDKSKTKWKLFHRSPESKPSFEESVWSEINDKSKKDIYSPKEEKELTSVEEFSDIRLDV